ncbi:MAG: hypothetical protein OXE95_02380 [Chloroflexi bacterium]|nr:hypothetical protein [Chloroflexota bacterium]MCY4246410.1 hypothetical protein [Chloroflexota bacterium]
MTIEYRVAIDRDHTGDFAADEDISGDVIALRWRLGMRAPYASMADYGDALITLRNQAGVYSPERSSLPIGGRVRIQSRRRGVARSHFVGFISHIEADAGELGQRQARLHLRDSQVWLAQSPAMLPPQVEVTADQVIGQLLDQAILRRPALAGYLFIDRPGSNMVDSARIFPAQSVAQELAAGTARFAYVGDWWDGTTSSRDAIGELAASERGRFYISRDGKAVFLNRRYTLLRKTIGAHFSDDMAGCAYVYGDNQLNRLTLQVAPRTVGEAGSLLWRLPMAQHVPPRSDTKLTLQLVDERGQPLGMLAFERLATRFQLGSSPESGVITQNIAVKVTQLGATSLQVRICNHNRRTVWLSLLNVYGRPLYRGAPLEVSAQDVASMHTHGLRGQRRSLPALSDVDTAQAFADYEVAQRRKPRGVIRELQLDAHQHPAAALDLSLFDRVRVSEAHTGHSARDYFIVAEAHEVGAGGAIHRLRWTLEPADMTRYFMIDSHHIDASDEQILPF